MDRCAPWRDVAPSRTTTNRPRGRFHMLTALFVAGLAAAGCDAVSEPQNTTPPAALPSAVALVVGQSSSLGASTSAGSATWYSDNPWIAGVSKSGVVAALHPGAAVVTRSFGGHTDSSLVTVRAEIAAVRLVTDTAGLPVGGTTAAAFHAYDTQGNEIIDLQGNSVQWTSSNDSIAKIDSTGVIVAQAAGATTVFLAVDGWRDSMWVRVHPQPPTSTPTNPPAPTAATVTVTLDSSSMIVGSSTQAHAVAKDASGNVLSGKTVTWSSLNTATATVSSTGVVTATGAGPVSIQATVDGVNGAASLTVSTPPQAPPPQSPAPQTPVSPTVAPISLQLDAGSYSSGSYALEAPTTLSGVASVQFWVDGKLYVTEWLPKYCLFSGDGPCKSGSLGTGTHTIQARAYNSAGAVLAQSASLTITEGTSSNSPPSTQPTTPPPSTSPTTPPVTSPSTSPPATTGSLAEPVFDATQNSMVYQTDFESYTNSQLNPTGKPQGTTFVNKLIVYGTAPAGTNTTTTLVSGHSGQAVQFQYTGTSQESPGIFLVGSGSTPATSTSVVQYWAKVSPLAAAISAATRLQIKWIMLWHGDPGNNRIQFNTTTGQGGCNYNNDPRAQTKWELYDVAYTGCNALQPSGPYWNTIADGQWHRFTHLVKTNSCAGCRDARALMWIDGVLVMRVEQSAVGVPAGGSGTSAGQPWCVQADVDQIIAGYGIGSPEFGGPLTDGTTPLTIAIDDFKWWR